MDDNGRIIGLTDKENPEIVVWGDAS